MPTKVATPAREQRERDAQRPPSRAGAPRAPRPSTASTATGGRTVAPMKEHERARHGPQALLAPEVVGELGGRVQRPQRVPGHREVDERPQQRRAEHCERAARARRRRRAAAAPRPQPVEAGQHPRLGPQQAGEREQPAHGAASARRCSPALGLERARPHHEREERARRRRRASRRAGTRRWRRRTAAAQQPGQRPEARPLRAGRSPNTSAACASRQTSTSARSPPSPSSESSAPSAT